MSNNALRVSYLLAIIAGCIISFVPAPWRLGGLLVALAAFILPPLSFIVKTDRKLPSLIAVERPLSTTIEGLDRAFLKPALAHSAHINTGGTMGPYYVDIDSLQTDHKEVQFLTQRVAQRVREAAQRLGGVDRLVFIERDAGPIGAVGLLGSLVAEMGVDAVIVRPKRWVLGGAVKPRDALRRDTRIVLITDVITGGGHIRGTIKVLKPYVEQKVFPVISLACRERAIAEKLRREGIELYSVYGPEELALILKEHQEQQA